VVLLVGAGAAAAFHWGGVAASSTPGGGTYTASAPWRLRIDGFGYGKGCTVTLTNLTSGDDVPVPGQLYTVARFQVASTGSFRWRSNDNRCLVTPLAGTGSAALPLIQEDNGDTDAIKAPSGKLAVHIVDNHGGNCTLRLFDTANGQELDIARWESGDGDVPLDPNSRPSVYVDDDNCVIRVTAQS
jgi:hypothetical protein